MAYDSGSYNSSGFKIFIFSIFFSLAFFVYIGLIHKGVDLKEIPEEASGGALLAQGEAAKKPSVDVSGVTEPWLETEDMVIHGKKVYTQTCALCHGAGGLGDGVAGKSLPVLPRDFIEGKWKSAGTRKALYEVVAQGQGASMASFAHLPKNDRWAVVHYIRSITKNKVKDDSAEVEAFGKTAQ